MVSKRMTSGRASLSNADIAELLALAAETAKMPLQKALRRASRKAFLWTEEAVILAEQGRSLTELPAIGPVLERIIRIWIAEPPEVPVPPEVRTGFLTLTEARAALAANPSCVEGLNGDLQMHTQWSDGSGNIEEMARAALDRGYGFIAVTDHSKGLKIAGGIDEEQLQQQANEIDMVHEKLRAEGLDFQVLRSIELNLDPRGSGDMDREAVARLDLVLGCFHSALRKKEDQTERYLAALRNPDIHILGHPRGRIYNFRLGLEADWPRVFAEAARLDKAVEIDCYPDRQDLNVELLKFAREHATRISLGTDAHHPWQLEFIDVGLAAALRARIPDDRILNFMPRGELQAWTQRLRDRNTSKT